MVSLEIGDKNSPLPYDSGAATQSNLAIKKKCLDSSNNKLGLQPLHPSPEQQQCNGVYGIEHSLWLRIN